jgi:hypothetical protein
MIRPSAVLLVVIMGFFLIGASPALAAGQDDKAPGLSKPYNWTGFYIGVNAGYGFGGNNSVNLGPGDPAFAQAFSGGGSAPARESQPQWIHWRRASGLQLSVREVLGRWARGRLPVRRPP